MRDQGRLVEWFDDKGYGFIQPNDATKTRVFLHIKDFSKRGPRPIVGCALEYQVTLDEKSRYRATDVVYLKAKAVQKSANKSTKITKPSMTRTQMIMQMLCIGAILVLAIGAVFGFVPSWLILFYLIINSLTYWLYAQDKQAAQQGKYRISEQMLHISSVLGGWAAAWLAQEKLRHKTQKQPFRTIYFCTIALNLLLMCGLMMYLR